MFPAGRRAALPRQPFAAKAIILEDDVYVGPHAVILKGVRVGIGAVIEPGAVVVRDVPSGARVRGNPAQLVNENDYDARPHQNPG